MTTWTWVGWERCASEGRHPKRGRIERNQDYVSKEFERWKELAARCLGEQDPAKLTELASEMNLVLTRKTPLFDPPLHAAGSNDEDNATF
jgi:hypothetical protein